MLFSLVVVVYPPPPVAWRWSDCPVVYSAAMLLLHFASSSATVMGLVHKSRGDNTVCICLQCVYFFYLIYF